MMSSFLAVVADGDGDDDEDDDVVTGCSRVYKCWMEC